MKTSEKDDLWMKIGKKLTYSINDFFLFIFIFHDSHNAKKNNSLQRGIFQIRHRRTKYMRLMFTAHLFRSNDSHE